MLNNNYLVGLYIRLSREDEDKTHESESISNQKSLLLQYTKENNLKVYDMYIDDGYMRTKTASIADMSYTTIGNNRMGFNLPIYNSNDRALYKSGMFYFIGIYGT